MEAYINRQVFPQAPSPTMTSLRRISAILMGQQADVSKDSVGGQQCMYESVETIGEDVEGCRVVVVGGVGGGGGGGDGGVGR